MASCPRLPYRRHLYWLIASGLDDDAIRRYYLENSFPFPPDVDFAALRLATDRDMMLPNGGRRRLERRKYAEGDHELMDRMGYGELYGAALASDRQGKGVSESWAEIAALIENPVLRVAVECAAIARVPAGDIPDLVQLGFKQTLGVDAYDIYKRVYFDIKGFTKEDWKPYLRLCADDVFTYSRYFAALTKPRDELFYLLGLPTEKQFSDFLKNVLLTADHKFRYWARLNDAAADDEARKWAFVGIEAGEKHAKHAKADIRNFADEVQSSFEYVEHDIPMATAEMLTDARPLDQVDAKTAAADKVAPGVGSRETENF